MEVQSELKSPSVPLGDSNMLVCCYINVGADALIGPMENLFWEQALRFGKGENKGPFLKRDPTFPSFVNGG